MLERHHSEPENMSNAIAKRPRGNVRYRVLALIVAVLAINLGVRVSLSIVGSDLAKEMSLSPVVMGYMFSAFAWSYVLGQLPGGWMLDRYGAIRICGISLFLWSLFTMLQGFVGGLPLALVVGSLIVLRLGLGFVESPAFPASNRIAATWFPTQERAFAAAVFNSSQYVAVVVFAPIMGLIAHSWGWRPVFWFMGALGIAMGVVWFRVMCNPRDHSGLSPAELEYIEAGGAVPPVKVEARTTEAAPGPRLKELSLLFNSRTMIGVYVAQYCITALQYFFITWFPIYLVQGRGMDILAVGFTAAVPGISGLIGAILGGLLSNHLLSRGYSLTVARKTPFIIGMLAASSLVLCNFTSSTAAVISLMAFAIFGKGLCAMGWVMVSDTAPRHLIGFAGGIFNMAGNLAGIVTPIVIGYILHATGSFAGALYFVALHSLVAAGCYAFVVGEIRRLEADTEHQESPPSLSHVR
jgi:ACS family glucarate transporter-like MFS transporter